MLIITMYFCSCVCEVSLCFGFFFFFQAEDGIRDGHVTGVQTCALPISRSATSFAAGSSSSTGTSTRWSRTFRDLSGRSEERRVGKSVDLGGGRIIKKKKKKKREDSTKHQ